MKIIRVFPRRTRGTPDDDLVRVGVEPDLFDTADRVDISVSFSWDLPFADRLSKAWKHVAQVNMGGPAVGSRGDSFQPGLYVKRGYVITSRGCPNRCWFCSVWRREGDAVRELPISDGWNVLDDNLLACSDSHIRSVFSMLARQPFRPEFTGGLEAKRLLPWHCSELKKLKTKQMFFAYDTDDDFEPLLCASRMLKDAGFTGKSHELRCYVLIGFPKDTFENAERRLLATCKAGFMPMAMLYRDSVGNKSREWSAFQRQWARPAMIKGVVS